MKGSHIVLAGALAALTLSACGASEAEPQTASGAIPYERMDLAAKDADGVPMLVEVMCSSCHAVKADAPSPLPQAPSFVSIANRDGLTRATLVAYLRDAHNYPDIMEVGLTDEDIEIIADYMISLKDPDYRRRPS